MTLSLTAEQVVDLTNWQLQTLDQTAFNRAVDKLRQQALHVNATKRPFKWRTECTEMTLSYCIRPFLMTKIGKSNRRYKRTLKNTTHSRWLFSC